MCLKHHLSEGMTSDDVDHHVIVKNLNSIFSICWDP